MCSCSHAEGTTSPKAAITLHISTIQGRVRSQMGDTLVHPAHKKTMMVSRLNITVVVIIIAVVTSGEPVTIPQTKGTVRLTKA